MYVLNFGKANNLKSRFTSIIANISSISEILDRQLVTEQDLMKFDDDLAVIYYELADIDREFKDACVEIYDKEHPSVGQVVYCIADRKLAKKRYRAEMEDMLNDTVFVSMQQAAEALEKMDFCDD